jgi:hypothetical protein
MKHTLETRQAQLLMQVYQNIFNIISDYVPIMDMEWEDYDDFERKYGSDNNPDNYIKRERIKNFFCSIGFLVRNRLVEAEKVYEVIGQGSIEFWIKFKDVYLKQRDIYNVPDYALDSEYLCTEMEKIRRSLGYPTYTSTMPLRYFPKQ